MSLMNALPNHSLLLKKRTYRKIAHLSKELAMKRSRLERFIGGELVRADLTLAEFELLSAHPTFADVLHQNEDETRKKFSVGNSVKYKTDDRERAMEILGRYILPPFLTVAKAQVVEPLTTTPYDLIFIYHVNMLDTSPMSTEYPVFQNNSTGRILFDPEDAKVFHDYLNELSAEDNLIGDDVLIEYFQTISHNEQHIWRNIFSDRKRPGQLLFDLPTTI